MNDSMRQRMETLAERGSPRGADAVLTAAHRSLHRRQRRLQGGFAAVVIMLVVASIGAYGLARRDDGSSTAVHTQPDQPELTGQAGELPDEIDGIARPLPDVSPWTIWISESVIPVTGADVVLAVRNTGGGDVSYGVGVEVEQWDGSQWHRVVAGPSCLEPSNCGAELSPDGAGFYVQPKLHVGAGQVGVAEYLRVGGLQPGWYRLTKELDVASKAAGMFAVVDHAVEVDSIAAALRADRIQVMPVVVPPRGGAIGVLAGLPGSETIVSETLQRWESDAWIDVDGGPQPSFNGMSIQTLHTADFSPRRLPDLEPGVHRVVWSLTDGTTATGIFWVDDDLTLADLSSRDVTQLTVEPAVVRDNVIRVYDSSGLAPGPFELQRWNGVSWVSDEQGLDAMRVPAGVEPGWWIRDPAPGAYRVVQAGADGANAIGLFWVESPDAGRGG